MSHGAGMYDSSSSRFPRVSGDEPVQAGTQPRDNVFSPRERG